ncbi:unnamed protein product, partial [Prorocentrum cordatum]
KWGAKSFDAPMAFLRTPIREQVFLEPPAEHRQHCIENFGGNPGDVVWKLNCTNCEPNEDTVDFDARCSKINIDELNMRRSVSEPSIYVSEDAKITAARHVDDGMAIGEGPDPDEFVEALGEHFLLQFTPEMTRGFSVRVAPKTIDSSLDHTGAQHAKAVATPGLKPEVKKDGEELLSDDEARYDLQLAAKKISRGMSQPTAGDALRLERAARYFGGAREFANLIAPEVTDNIVARVRVDSDWAGDKI